MTATEGSKFQEQRGFKKHGTTREASPFLCEVHGINSSGPSKTVVVYATSGDEALNKCKKRFGENYAGTYRTIDAVIH